MAIRTNLINIDKIDLYWFSGTGNSLLIARAFADQMAKLKVEVQLRALPCPAPLELPPGRALALVFPVHGQTVPQLVRLWIEELPKSKTQTPVIAISTLGLASGLVKGPLSAMLEARGYRPLAIKEILMPCNFFLTAPSEINDYLVWRGEKKARFFAHKVVMETASWPRRAGRLLLPFHKLSLWVGNRLARFIGARFKTNSKCHNCGLCAKMCPTRNIRETETGPKWGNHCVLCLRCLNFCPAGAIKNSLCVFTLPRHRAANIKPGDFLRPGRAMTMFRPRNKKRAARTTRNARKES